MRDQFVGDVHDFVKYTVLGALSRRYKVGVVWYYNSDKSTVQSHGSSRTFLRTPGLQALAPEIWEASNRWAAKPSTRNLKTVESLPSLKNCTFFGEERPDGRPGHWRRKMMSQVKTSQIVFMDPDNGPEPSSGYTHAHARWTEILEVSKAKEILLFWHRPQREARAAFLRRILAIVEDETGFKPRVWYCAKAGHVALVGFGGNVGEWGRVIDELAQRAPGGFLEAIDG